MAIGGSPTSRRITAWHHTCCNTVRWSGQRVCDLCGTQTSLWHEAVPISTLMERLHAEDKAQRLAAPVQDAPAAARAQGATSAPAHSGAAVAAAPVPVGPPTTVSVRPPGARPHRNHEDDEAPAPRAPWPSLADRWSTFHTLWLAGAIALVFALGMAASTDRGGDPLLPALIAVAAILVVLAPMAMAGQSGEAAR